MKLATIRTATGTTAVRVEEDGAVELGAADLGELLTRPDWKTAVASADGARPDIAHHHARPLEPADSTTPRSSPARRRCSASG